MDPQYILELANTINKLKMYPYFELAHFIVTCIAVREDLGLGWYSFSRKHPLACWASCMAAMFAGSILANFLLGEPVLVPFKNNNNIILATAVWYAIFYAPFDLAYTIARFFPIRIALAAAKEVLRCKKVHDGVSHAVRVYPTGYLIMVIIGTVKGTGSDFMRILERLIRGTWTPTSMALLHPTFSTKACIAASILFVLEKKTDFFTAPHALVYAGAVVFFVYFKLSSMLLGIHDPFLPFENLFCFFFLGGIWDLIVRASEWNKEQAAAAAAASPTTGASANTKEDGSAKAEKKD